MTMQRMKTSPRRVKRSRRPFPSTVLTSLPAGKMVPIEIIDLLREDGLGYQARVTVEMQETKEILMNPTYLHVTAFLVPHLAKERFNGSQDLLNKSYMGLPLVDGGQVVPFVETQAAGALGANPIKKYLGLHHGATGDLTSTNAMEVYNLVWNYRATQRSPRIAHRARLLNSLAPAFWMESRLKHIVPIFDDALVDGEVGLRFAQPRIPIQNLYTKSNGNDAGSTMHRNSDGSVYPNSSTGLYPLYAPKTAPAGVAAVYAEMQDGGLTVSLADIAAAKKTVAYAKLRQEYNEHDEQYVIDMLMSGLSIPDQSLKQPMLVFNGVAQFQQAKRYSTTSGSLQDSATNGMAQIDVSINIPPVWCGGTVMIFAEALPEQLYEREADTFEYLTQGSGAQFPEAVRDDLDVQKVDTVLNRNIDVTHNAPTGTFGYEPMNGKYARRGPRIGGKFHRPAANATTDTYRQRLWAYEQLNPTLSESFYIVKDLQIKPFLDQTTDVFEATCIGMGAISGLTVFGPMLHESTDDYDKIAAKAPTTQIKPTPAP